MTLSIQNIAEFEDSRESTPEQGAQLTMELEEQLGAKSPLSIVPQGRVTRLLRWTCSARHWDNPTSVFHHNEDFLHPQDFNFAQNPLFVQPVLHRQDPAGVESQQRTRGEGSV